MQSLLLGLLALGQQPASPSANIACAPQPLPEAIDSAGEARPGPRKIEFAATPSLAYPGRAWVVRLVDQGARGGIVEVVRLQQLSDCNRYVVSRRWETRIDAAQVAAIAEEVLPFGAPPPDVFRPGKPLHRPGVVFFDGTAVVLRLRALDWQAQRSLHLSSTEGARVGAVFHRLVVKHIGAGEAPTSEW